MSKNSLSQGFSTIVIVIIAALVLLGVGGFIMSRDSGGGGSSSLDSGSESIDTADSGALEGETTSTLPDVIGRGQSLECDWKMPIEEGESPFDTGKLYTTENKGRSMIKGSTSGVAMEGNAIYEDNEVYSWITVAGTTVGFKFSEAELSDLNSGMTAEEKQQAESIRSEMIVECSPWTPDESMFTLPSGVTFE